MYQQNNADSTSEKFSNIFENILNNIAPIKIGDIVKINEKAMVIQSIIEPY